MGLATGELLRNRYSIIRAIKSGGMGSVFEAVDTSLANTPCAVKEVLEAALTRPDAGYILKTFELEVKALSNLDHPCIPKIRDYFQEGERRYIVMELVRGHSMDVEIRDHVELCGRGLPPGKAVADMIGLLETCSYLHRLKPSIVHRDIKPANIIRDEKSGRIKLVDFGLARHLQDTLTPQTMVGTMGFCAPEQLSGNAEPRSDIYSVGATLYHLLMGRAPLMTFQALQVVGCDAQLTAIIAKATELQIQDRYATALEMAEALRAWQLGPQLRVPEPPITVKMPPPESPEKHSQWAWVGVVGLALGLGLWGGHLFTKSTVETISPEPLVDTSPLAVTENEHRPKDLQANRIPPPPKKRVQPKSSSHGQPSPRVVAKISAPELPSADLGPGYPSRQIAPHPVVTALKPPPPPPPPRPDPPPPTASPVERTFAGGYHLSSENGHRVFTRSGPGGFEKMEVFNRNDLDHLPARGGPENEEEASRAFNTGPLAENWSLNPNAPNIPRGIRVLQMRGSSRSGAYVLGRAYIFKYTTTGAFDPQTLLNFFKDREFVNMTEPYEMPGPL